MAEADAALLRLVREAPFAWVVGGAGQTLRATPLPLRPRLAADGSIESLAGHLARANPLVETLRAAPVALILFLGPHGYVSPSWLSDRTQAPTWNYASAQFLVDVALVEEPADLRALLDDLVAAMEAGRPRAWRAAEMGERYDRIARRIVGFTARVRAVRPGFKLSQADEARQWGEVIAGLEAEGGGALAQWMTDLRSQR